MLDFSNRPKEKKESPLERKAVWDVEKAKSHEQEIKEAQKERLPIEQQQEVYKQLRQEIEEMQLVPELQKEAENKSKKIDVLNEKEKLEELLILAREKGIEFAVKVAKNMNDAYILDLFHDLLVKQGFYKQFLNQVASNPAQQTND